MTVLNRRRWIAATLGLGAGTALRAQPGYEWRPWPAGRRAPGLDLTRLDGSPWRLAESRGRVLLANFWASWCEPCRAEMPSLARLAQRRDSEGLSVVAVNYREGESAIRRFVDSLGIDALPVLLDRDGTAAAAWTPRIFPSTVVFDRRGRPAGVLVGEIDWEGAAAQALLDPLLAARTARQARLSSDPHPLPIQGEAA
jgi:thiol-disulfide isomerase/thioredoxin